MNFLRRTGALIVRYYDRILAGLAVVVFLGAVAWAVIRLGTMSIANGKFAVWMSIMSPAHPEATAADVKPYEQALASLTTPPQLGSWTNALLVPETRVWCVDCLRPITMETEVCPFCLFRQPPDAGTSPELDSDYDGIPDKWETDHGMDPRNIEDAAADGDSDGFSNLEEFKAVPASDPALPGSHPAYATKLELGPVVSEPFRLLFKGVSTLPDGSKSFQINTRDRGQTYFVKLRASVEGFTLVKYEEKFENRNSSVGTQHVNVSVLTLQRERMLIPLTLGKSESYVEYKANLILTLDTSEIPLKKPGETLTVRNEVYKVITVDIQKGTVVIERLSDGKQFDIRRQPQTVSDLKPVSDSM